MNFSAVKSISIFEGNVSGIAIGGVNVWSAKKKDKYTWDAVFASIDAGTYATDYAIGDMIPLDLGTEGVVNMQIAAFDADNKADGSGKAPISWISKELLKTSHHMNSALSGSSGAYVEGTGTIGGWEKCGMRTYLNNTIYPLIPESVRSRLVTVMKNQQAVNTAGNSEAQTTADGIWIPSSYEMFGDVLIGETSSMPKYTGFFTSDTERKKQYIDGSAAVQWWLRSAEHSFNFFHVQYNGQKFSNDPSRKYGIALCFCT